MTTPLVPSIQVMAGLRFTAPKISTYDIDYVCIKAPMFSFHRLIGDLSPAVLWDIDCALCVVCCEAFCEFCVMCLRVVLVCVLCLCVVCLCVACCVLFVLCLA